MPSEYITPVEHIAAKGDIRTGSKGLASSVFAPGHLPCWASHRHSQLAVSRCCFKPNSDGPVVESRDAGEPQAPTEGFGPGQDRSRFGGGSPSCRRTGPRCPAVRTWHIGAIIPSPHGPLFGLEGAAHGARVGKTPSQPQGGVAFVREIWSPGYERQTRKIPSLNVDSIMYVVSQLTLQAKPTYPWPAAGATNEISEGMTPGRLNRASYAPGLVKSCVPFIRHPRTSPAESAASYHIPLDSAFSALS